MDISVVIPLYNEEESLPELSAWIGRVMAANNFTYEIIMVDDGSNDKSWKVIEQLSTQDNRVRGIKFRRNYGKSAALHCGFEDAQETWLLPWMQTCRIARMRFRRLYHMIMEEDYDLISGLEKRKGMTR